MFIIKDELDHFEENFARIIQIILSKRSDPDPTWPKVLDPTGSGSGSTTLATSPTFVIEVKKRVDLKSVRNWHSISLVIFIFYVSARYIDWFSSLQQHGVWNIFPLLPAAPSHWKRNIKNSYKVYWPMRKEVGWKWVSVDSSRFKLLTRIFSKKYVQSPSCERAKTDSSKGVSEYDNCFQITAWCYYALCEHCIAARYWCLFCKQLLYSNNRNRVRWAVLCFSRDEDWIDFFEILKVNSLKRVLLSNDTTNNPLLFSLGNTAPVKQRMLLKRIKNQSHQMVRLQLL
jgi:hypothetical protein